MGSRPELREAHYSQHHRLYPAQKQEKHAGWTICPAFSGKSADYFDSNQFFRIFSIEFLRGLFVIAQMPARFRCSFRCVDEAQRGIFLIQINISTRPVPAHDCFPAGVLHAGQGRLRATPVPDARDDGVPTSSSAEHATAFGIIVRGHVNARVVMDGNGPRRRTRARTCINHQKSTAPGTAALTRVSWWSAADGTVRKASGDAYDHARPIHGRGHGVPVAVGRLPPLLS